MGTMDQLSNLRDYDIVKEEEERDIYNRLKLIYLESS